MPHTLLLADDSVTIQRVIELTFADEDIRVITVSDGDEAIAAVNENPPDIVLADIAMPGRSGYEVAQHIRDTPRLAHIPVLLLTGAFEPVDQARAVAAGCDGVLSKPFEPQLVIGKVKELLARPAPAADAPMSPIDALLAAPPRQEVEGLWDGSFPDDPPAAPKKATTPLDVEDYFDRLDQAFASLTASPAPAPRPAPEPASAHDISDWFGGSSASPAAPDIPVSYGSPQREFDRFSDVAAAVGAPAAEGGSGPISWTPEPVSAAFEIVHHAAAADPVRQPEPGPAWNPAPEPELQPEILRTPEAAGPSALVDTAVLNAAPAPASPAPAVSFPPLEDAFAALLAAEQGAPPPSIAPAWPAAPAAVRAVVPEDIVEQVTRLVLERLTDQVVRETVGQIVADVAERLIREEIDRIKSNIK